MVVVVVGPGVVDVVVVGVVVVVVGVVVVVVGVVVVVVGVVVGVVVVVVGVVVVVVGVVDVVDVDCVDNVDLGVVIRLAVLTVIGEGQPI